MSKKMMKRSLALGALMAFVITGSAMAAEEWSPITTEGIGLSDSGNPAYKNNVSSVDVVDLKITSGSNTIYVCGPSKNLDNPDMTISANTINLTANSSTGAAVILNSADGAYGKIDIDFVDSMELTANGKAHGISNVSKYGLIDIDGTGNFILKAAENAVYARADGAQIDINANNITIESTGEDEGGDTVRGNAVVVNKKASVNLVATQNVNLVAIEGKDAISIPGSEDQVNGAVVSISAGNNIDVDGQIYSRQGSKVKLEADNNVTVDTNGEDAIISSGSTVEVEASNIYITSMKKDGIQTEGSNGVALTADNVEIKAGAWGVNSTGDANSSVNISTDNLVITGEEGGVRSLGNGSTVNLNATNSTQITGDVVAANTSEITANFNGTDSFLTGTVTTSGENANTALTFNDGATWNVTGESNVSTLAGNDAKISVVDAEEAEGWVTVGENETDMLTVVTASETTDTEGTLQALSKVVVTTDEEGKQIAAADEVQLTNAVYDNITAEVNGLGEVSVKDKVVAAANYSVSDMAAIGLMSWRAEMNDMNKRMGELRNANGEHGVWVRMVRGEDEYNSVKHQYNQYQLGYDEKLSTDPSWTVGVALSYTDGESSFAQGNGENTNKALSIYGSKLNEDGSFIDLIAKYARLENDFDTFGGMGGADYSTNGYSVSAEFGKRIQQGNGVWVEPQVELSYGKVSAVDYLSDRGLKVAQDGMESIVGRVGFSLGKDIKDGNVYARASYLYDFDGETSVSLGGQEKLEQDLGGGWWEVGVGANINLSKATYIYADVEKTFGGEVDTNWQWNLGVRYSF